MSTTIEGTFRGGKIEFAQTPPARDGDRVLVTFLTEAASAKEHKMIRYGMFQTDADQQTSWEDFQEAKRAVYKNLAEDKDADAARG